MDNLFEPGNDQPNTRAELEAKWADKSEAEVRKAKVDADLHIMALEREKAELRQMYAEQREELLAKAKWDDYLNRVTTHEQTPVAPTPANDVMSPQQPDIDFDKLFETKLSLYEKAKAEADNFKIVQSKLKERFGNNSSEVLKDQSNMLGLSSDEVHNLAKKSPEAFFRVMGLNDTRRESYTTPPRNTQLNDSFAPRTIKRDWNYYQELKRKDPMIYLDPKIAVQMEKDAHELGEAFGLPPD